MTGLRVLRSEWAKFWSLRSSWITLGRGPGPAGRSSGRSPRYTYSPDVVADGPPGHGSGGSDAVSLALTGVTFASLAVGVLGVLLSAGEYSTGMIRSTLAAVPRRLPVLWSKSAVIGAIALVLTTVGALAAFQLGVPGPGRREDRALAWATTGCCAAWPAPASTSAWSACSGVALGVLLRSSAGRHRGPGRRPAHPARPGLAAARLAGTTRSPPTSPATRGRRCTPCTESADSLCPRTGARGLRRLGGPGPRRSGVPAGPQRPTPDLGRTDARQRTPIRTTDARPPTARRPARTARPEPRTEADRTARPRRGDRPGRLPPGRRACTRPGPDAARTAPAAAAGPAASVAARHRGGAGRRR